MWNGWPVERAVLLFSGIAFLLISLQVAIFHYRQNFRHWVMYTPVAAGPVLGLLAVIVSFYNLPLLRTALALFLMVGTGLGVVGSILHINGIGQRVGGYGESQNYLVGPPPILPMMVSAISILGLIALLWR